MSIISQHVSSVIALLNDRANYAVLRNFEGLPDHNDARDIDIIITRKSFKRVRPDLLRLFDETGWKILTYLNSDRLITYVCMRIDGHEVSIMQWDFFFDTSVWGIRLMSAEEFLEHKEFNGFLYCVGVGCQFLDKYLYNRAVGSQYPKKYHATRAAAEHLPMVESKLKSIFGYSSVASCDKASGKRLILRALGHNLAHRPAGCITEMCRFARTFVGNYLCSRTGFSIGFTGPDGSGKTTVIDLMIEKLGATFRTAHAYYHFRPALFGNLGEVAHSAGLKKEVDRNFSDPHRGRRTGALSSLARLCYYSADYILGYFLKVKTKIRITRIVIFDRYFTDIICDSRRSRIYLPTRLLNIWRKLLIPSLDYNILLTADTDTILARKAELDRRGIEDINAKIDFMATQKGYYKILNDGTPDDAVTRILTIVLDHQHQRNLKRLR